MFGLPAGILACLFDMDGVVTQTALFLQSRGISLPEGSVFEDAQSGVAAGRAGHFAFVVGVDRVGQAEELLKHGADIVVKDLAELLD